MIDLADCRAMELMYRQRAKTDPQRSWKWLGRAERWRELGKQQAAWRFQGRNRQQQMHTGPMATGPNPGQNGSRWKQMG
jgi:hypothetical protein